MKKIVVAGVVSAVLALVVGPELDGVSGIIMPEKKTDCRRADGNGGNPG